MDAASVRRAMKDVRYLVHVAADYRLWARDPGEIVRNNREGTRTIMQAAHDEGVEKIVYTSSVATLKPGHAAVDETARAAEAEAIGAYKKSKVAAERVVEAMIADRDLPAVIVHPSTPIGPRDVKPTPTGRIIVETAMGRIPAFVDTGLNLVHVDDVAEGHVLALEKGKVGERYILGGENVALRDMLATIAPLAGRRAPRLKLPRAPLFPIAYVAEAAARFTGREPLITADALKMAKHHMFFTSAKAERELGYRARPYGEGLVDAVKWFRDAGYLR
jgi:dihydroflavonol-4-reductase